MDSADQGFGESKPFSSTDPIHEWGGKIPSSKRISLQANENLHYEGTYYLALKELLDHAAAERIAKADMRVDDFTETALWFFLRHADISHHLASEDINSSLVRIEALEHYRGRLKKACAALKAGKRLDADEFFGQALHTLQDSFSHSDEHGNPMLSEEHDKALDHPKKNPIKAGLALQETEKVIRKYSKEIEESGAFDPKLDCDSCAYWDSEVLFKMPRPKAGRRGCAKVE